jgi:Ran GTPase-activating protein (RanGAP) involved in mRNA processing and transport
MIITDYERATNLKDVAISLTREEAEELALYLHALLKRPNVQNIHLSEVRAGRIDKDICFNLANA